MDNFTETIKNILKLMKNKLINKADLNNDNIFKGEICINKKLLIKDKVTDRYIDIMDLIQKTSHTHDNLNKLNIISDKIVSETKHFTYDGIPYQKKLPYEIDSKLLSKFEYIDGILYFDSIKVIDPETRPQKSYSKNEKIVNNTVTINLSDISSENNIHAITNSELIVTNNNTEDLVIKITNIRMEGISEVIVPSSKMHIYSLGINKETLVEINGTFDYSITINYF